VRGDFPASINLAGTFAGISFRCAGSQNKNTWGEKHAAGVLKRLEMDVFPYIGHRPIGEIESIEFLQEVLRKIEKRGAIDIAHRVRGLAGKVFRYGVSTARCKQDITVNLGEALRSTRTKHFAAIDTKDIPEFLRTLEKNEARQYPRTRRAMRMLMLTFVRTHELIEARWEEFDFEESRWVIPAERMKMKRDHIVPLSRQVFPPSFRYGARRWVMPPSACTLLSAWQKRQRPVT
jgi:integrase